MSSSSHPKSSGSEKVSSSNGAAIRDKVVHNYVDRSKEPDPEAADSNGGKTGLDHNFCVKLHYLLENSQDQSHVISWQVRTTKGLIPVSHQAKSPRIHEHHRHTLTTFFFQHWDWQPHGRCFMVHDMKEFVSSMLPLWFRQSKFASFQRQLNLYGFQRLTQGKSAPTGLRQGY
jgi:HSF-type DNA-binding